MSTDFLPSELERLRILADPKLVAKIAEALSITTIPFKGRRFLLREQIAAFFGLEQAAIDDVLASYGSELAKSGYMVLRGDGLRGFLKALGAFESEQLDLKKIAGRPQLGLFDIPAFLDLALLLRNCPRAAEFRKNVIEACLKGLPCGELRQEDLLREKKPSGVAQEPPISSTDSAAITRAISIRQPYVEQILQGVKTEEYRSAATRIRERVWLYASLRYDTDEAEDWRIIGCEPGELPVGQIVGSVEIVDCRFDEELECFAYALARPERLARPLKAKNQPQPKFWIPQF